jgi:hypothetical protein
VYLAPQLDSRLAREKAQPEPETIHRCFASVLAGCYQSAKITANLMTDKQKALSGVRSGCCALLPLLSPLLCAPAIQAKRADRCGGKRKLLGGGLEASQIEAAYHPFIFEAERSLSPSLCLTHPLAIRATRSRQLLRHKLTSKIDAGRPPSTRPSVVVYIHKTPAIDKAATRAWTACFPPLPPAPQNERTPFSPPEHARDEPLCLIVHGLMCAGGRVLITSVEERAGVWWR